MNSTCFTATFVDSALTLSTAYAIKVSYRMIVHFELIFSHAIFLLESAIFFSTNPFSPSELCMLFLQFVPATIFTLHLADPLNSFANLDLLFHPVNSPSLVFYRVFSVLSLTDLCFSIVFSFICHCHRTKNLKSIKSFFSMIYSSLYK
jgi:hypothetical protein